MPELNELLEGPTAIAFVNDGDMVAVAKTLNETARRTKVLELKGGILQGKPMTADQVRNLATLPPVEALRGEVLGAIIAPLNAIAGLVNAPLQNLLGLIDARIEQLREEGDTSDAAAPAEEEGGAGSADAEETTVDADVGAEPAPPADAEETDTAPEAAAEPEETKEEEE
jgi:large subunit ribosomal protein L10